MALLQLTEAEVDKTEEGETAARAKNTAKDFIGKSSVCTSKKVNLGKGLGGRGGQKMWEEGRR
jgi:hypothetical protein